MRGPRALAVAALTVFVMAGSTAAEPAGLSHVRGLNPASRKLIAEALERSAIIRDLVDALERTDVVVYVRLDLFEHQTKSGYLSFLATAGGSRYVVVKIDCLAFTNQRI